MGQDVFSDIGFSKEDSEKLKIKSILMMYLTQYIKRSGMTQEQAARTLGVRYQSRISDLIRGRIDKFTIDALVKMVARTDHHVNVSVELDKVA